MITLTRKLKKESTQRNEPSTTSTNNYNTSTSLSTSKRISIRDQLLVKDIQEMEQNMPCTCRIDFTDPDVLSEFTLTVCPDEGFWQGGKFRFEIVVTEEYNIAPPIVKCATKLWHPNITVEGDVCLSLLRQNSIDGLGWAPTRTLKDVIWGLNSLFTDLLNFEDPLNTEAAKMYSRDRNEFENRVREYLNRFARR
uniref:E2 NEDD8-conjugating enzyme n=1 Tax=Xenopsylla cheopis TaxID=163159 RepID=A0A6M2DTB1_XENCH